MPNDRYEEPTQKEASDWNKYVKDNNLTSIDIPYAFTIGAVTLAGLIHLRDPFENSSIEGAAVGAIIGTFNLDKNHTEAKLYDPTGQLLRLVIVLDFQAKELKARIDTRRWDGGWSKGSWAIIWRG